MKTFRFEAARGFAFEVSADTQEEAEAKAHKTAIREPRPKYEVGQRVCVYFDTGEVWAREAFIDGIGWSGDRVPTFSVSPGTGVERQFHDGWEYWLDRKLPILDVSGGVMERLIRPYPDEAEKDISRTRTNEIESV